MKTNIFYHNLSKHYENRTGAFLNDLSKCSSVDIVIKLEKCLIASNVVFLNISKLLEEVGNTLNNHYYAEKYFNTQVKGGLKFLDFIELKEISEYSKLNSVKLKQINSKVASSQNILETKRQIIETIILCFSQSAKSASKIFENANTVKNKNALKTFVKFVLTLEPFFGAIDALNQIINSDSNSLKTAEKYIQDKDNYFEICLSHAVSTLFLSKLLKSFNEKEELQNIDIQICHKEIHNQIMGMATDMHNKINNLTKVCTGKQAARFSK